MRTEIAKRLATALRSGDFRQGRKKLVFRDRDGKVCHCVIGVLAELAVEDGVLDREGPADAPHGYVEKGREGSTPDAYTPPFVLQEWAGDLTFPITREAEAAFPELKMFNNRRLSLIFLNDGKNWSFKKIADYLDYARENGVL